jgi:plastocyanin
VLRRALIALPLAVLLAVPASAADESVQATPSNTFDPAEVTIDLGDSVTWTNTGGFHNVKFDDGEFTEPSSPSTVWTSEVKRTFDKPGIYKYYCQVHGGPNGSGMSGEVRVRDASGQVPEPAPPPGLTLTTKGKQSLDTVLKGVAVKAACKGGCTVAIGVFDGKKSVGGTSASLDAGAAPKKFVIKLKKSARKRLAKREKTFKLEVRAHAVNPGGDHSLERTINVKP